MSVKSIVLLLLLSIVTQVTECDHSGSKSMDYTCNLAGTQLMNCSNNPRIRVDKSEEIYRLIFCANNQCTENITIKFECCDICEACGILTG
jgi:hypothetical protein